MATVQVKSPAAKAGNGKAKAGNGKQKAAQYTVQEGRPHPLGAIPDAGGVNFSVYSEHATGVELLLFDAHDDGEPMQTVVLDPAENKTFHFWHVYVAGLKAGVHYAYRVDGPSSPEAVHQYGHRFNRNKVLIDPYAKANTNTLWNRGNACGEQDNLETSMRSVVIDLEDYDWEGDQPLNRPMHQTSIYEMHVGGFTRSPSSRVKDPGTFSAVVEKIPYLKSLGVTAVELLPVCEFDETEVVRNSPIDGKPLTNYWGYSTLSFFAPDAVYCINPEVGDHVKEFRDMVKALHREGIEVILDVVFNHTNEGNHQGPMINFKGFDNSTYYYQVGWDKQYYMDYSGCGNTMNCNHPITEKFIVDCLEFWVKEMHVDGFRFDEGSILTRGEDGGPMEHPPVVWQIELSETLADTKIIAEAWDAAGLYQVGYFPGYRWCEWNGRFRDDVRKFIKGEPGMVGEVASRIAGSADIYQARGHLPINSVNFVTCHDGFTLNDTVSYDGKHNEANGENNQDGVNDNYSWNCGWEGPTDDPGIEALRRRQIKNFATILLVAQGIPMLCMGDEVRRTQGGNNNAYCQDNAISWLDWKQVEKEQEIFRFFSQMLAFRQAHPVLQCRSFFIGEPNELGKAYITWHGTKLNSPGWTDPAARAFAFTVGGFTGDPHIHVMMNMFWEPLDFELPTEQAREWFRVVDTSQPSPQDILAPGQEIPIPASTYRVDGRSCVVLISKRTTN